MAWTLVAGGAAAQDSDDEEPADDETLSLGDIFVTAQGRREKQETIPISLTAFSGRDIEERQIEGVQEYFLQTPNVSFTNNGNRARSQVAVRGVGNIGGRANTLGIYVDGFNVAPGQSIRTFDPALIDIESLAILRGPQGTYFGRNATAGAISITTVKPQQEWGGSAEIGFERFNTWKARAVVNAPILKDVLAVRVASYVEQSDGFIENTGPGSEADLIAGGGRASLRWTPTENFTYDVSARLTRSDQGANNFVARDPMTLDVPDRLRIATDFNQRSRNEGFLIVGNGTLDFGLAKLTSITGYITNDYLEVNDRDETIAAELVGTAGNDLESMSQEVRIDVTLFDQVDLIVGGIIARDELGTDGVFFTDRDNRFNDTIFELSLDEETETWAVFADAVWHATPQLDVGLTEWGIRPRVDITLGGRHTEVVTERKDRQSALFFPGFPPTVATNPGQRERDRDFSYRAILTIHLNDSVLAYVSNSTGFKNGGGTGIVDLGEARTFDDERIRSWEAGLKARLFQERLRLTGAVFRYDWKDLQVRTAGDPMFPSLIQVQNAARARSEGFEVEATALPCRGLDLIIPCNGLELGFGAGYVKAEYERFRDASFEGAPAGGADLTGEVLPRAPEWTLNGYGQYTFPAINTGRLGLVAAFLRGEWSYVDDTFFDVGASFLKRTTQDRRFFVPSYSVVNLRAGFESDRFRLVGYVENLADRKYFTGVRRSFQGDAFPERVDPHPRIFGIRLTAYL
ncbi:MAG: TonB-dependent receptor [Myxococcota bacterium]